MNKFYWMDKIKELMKDYHPLFGSVWWYSLVHEKNTFKSMAFHNFVMQKPSAKWIFHHNKFVRIKSVLKGIRKYFVFIYRVVNTVKTKINYSDFLIVSYGESHLKMLEKYSLYPKTKTVIAIPTKNNYGRLFEDYIFIDQFITLKDFFIVLYRALKTVVKFLTKCDYDFYLHEDMWRSFAGDILIEGLFFEQAFKNLAKQFKGSKVIYVYEGHAWEKALCLAFKDKEKIAIMQSAPGENMLHYYYLPEELNVMPTPDRIGTFGIISYNTMKKIYGDKTFIIGDLTGNKIFDLVKNKSEYSKKHDIIKIGQEEFIQEKLILVFLSPVKKMNEEIMQWVMVHRNMNEVMVKTHRDDNTVYEKQTSRDLYDCLKQIREVITFTSGFAIEAACLGIEVTIPKLKSFADMRVEGIGSNFEDYFTKLSIEEVLNRL